MKSNDMNYQNYTTEDFVLDQKFRQWVEKPDTALENFWNEFLIHHPEKIDEVNSAKAILQEMKFKKYRLSVDEISSLWTGIEEGKKVVPLAYASNMPAVHQEHQHAEAKGKEIKPRRQFLFIAASMSMLFIFTALIFWLSDAHEEKVYATDFGETRSIQLADGSTVTLNAHSTLRVPEDWGDDESREVWLEGEAFFQVKKISQNDNLKAALPYKFVVHTQGVAVEVLGTQFNVNTRREKVQVVLNSGKVKLRWKEQEVLMNPGEMVEVSQTGEEVSQKIVKPENYSSWKDNHLLCDATPLYELANTIEDRFGYTLVFQDESLKNIEVSGTIPLDNIETFNLVISSLVKANIELKGKKIYISK